ncbi:small membrane hydrophobic protein [Kitasatospora griseola]|uniref:Small membrane hydrophobic protein n=1 Tax=Kitasatospora griseola TaxID=2064 RepID=A0A0D0P739_KITGR|nr:small membrane hydrophobic protein [Kitasatospora griseola]
MLLGLFPLWFGLSYILAPESTAPSFGLPVWPHGDAAMFLITKGIRDVVSGLVPLALLLLGHRRASGWAMLVTALVPIGDATTILTHHGSALTAFTVHFATAAVMIAVAALVLTERREAKN